MRSKSTDIMQKILSFAEEYYLTNGKSPSTREIGEHIGIAKATAYKYLIEMDSRNMLKYDGSIILTETTKKRSVGLSKAAILDNAISCGKPEYEEEHISKYVMLPSDIFGEGEFYILTASGDSMIEVGIESGDKIVIKKQNTASFGDIIVALADGQNTLKTYAFDKEKNRVMLKAENKSYAPIYPEELYIQGVAVNVIKTL